MALKVFNPGGMPLGQFDSLDSQVSSFKGGEVVTLTGVTPKAYGGTDLSAFDSQDGYVGQSTKTRPVVTLTLGTSAGGPYWLSDEGVAGYGTLFGTVVGGTVGQVVTGGTVLGPSTALGPGKITCWDKPGIYGVTLDACDTNTSTGLQPTNTTLAVGAPLYATPAGLLTPNSGAGTADAGAVLANFIEFSDNGSLVTTPQSLVAAANSPSGSVSSVQTQAFTVAIFSWRAVSG